MHKLIMRSVIVALAFVGFAHSAEGDSGAIQACVNSKDGTLKVLEDMRREKLNVLVRPGKLGLGSAHLHAWRYAIEHGYDIVVVVSGGGKTPPEQIPRLLEPIVRGEAEFAQGSRYLEGGEFLRMPLRRRLGTRGYTLLFSLFCGHRVTDASKRSSGTNLWSPRGSRPSANQGRMSGGRPPLR